MQFDKSFTSHFVDPTTGLPITGLTGVRITILQRNDDNTYTKVVDNVLCTEIMEGWYHYVFSAIQDKFYLYAIYPNDDRVHPESGFVDKRLNNLDGAITDIRTGGGYSVNISGIQTSIRNARDNIVEEMSKEHQKTREIIISENNETNSHIELAKTDLSDKIESIDIPEAILEEKEAKKAIKLITTLDKKVSTYIDSEKKEKDEIGAITRELTKLELEDQKEMIEKKRKEDEDRKLEEEEQKKEEKRIAEMLNAEFDKLEEEDKIEKKKELEKELEETLNEAKEIEIELKSL